jgi:hypothetical protein
MDAIFATIADGGQAINDIDREAGRNKLISFLIYHFILNLSMVASANPFHKVCWWQGMFHHKNHAAGEANSSIIVGMFVCCVFC